MNTNDVQYTQYHGGGNIDAWIAEACRTAGLPDNDHWVPAAELHAGRPRNHDQPHRVCPMKNEELIKRVYAAYNRQNCDPLLALVSEDVDWPDAQRRSERIRIVAWLG
jgi:hypothetical protein